jgi:hypothetical protein
MNNMNNTYFYIILRVVLFQIPSVLSPPYAFPSRAGSGEYFLCLSRKHFPGLQTTYEKAKQDEVID